MTPSNAPVSIAGMVEMYIDADACPVKDEALRVAERHGIKVFMVSNSWLLKPVGPNVEKVVVSDGFDATDHWIVDHTAPRDVVITADIALADRCIKKGAFVLAPSGRAFTTANIGNAMAMRELSSQLRDMGEISGYNPSFTKQDKSRFLQELEIMIQKAKRP